MKITQDEHHTTDVFISFKNIENGGYFYYSTKYTTIETFRDEETGQMTGAELGRQNIH